MAEADLDGVRLFYEERGDGTPLVFSHSYLADSSHFASQIADLSRNYRVLAYEHRDHGRSARVEERYGMEEIYRDGESFLERVVGEKCHFVGLSAGGFVGLRVAIRRPDLVRSVTIIGSTADLESFGRRIEYEVLFLLLRLLGPKPLGGRVMHKMFGSDFLRDPARTDEREKWRRKLTSVGTAETIRFGRAILGRRSVVGELGSIEVPCLVIAGESDRAISPGRSEQTAALIPGCRYEVLPRAGHLSTVEVPDRVNAILRSFLDEPG